jgi:hypothetical protein
VIRFHAILKVPPFRALRRIVRTFGLECTVKSQIPHDVRRHRGTPISDGVLPSTSEPYITSAMPAT